MKNFCSFPTFGIYSFEDASKLVSNIDLSSVAFKVKHTYGTEDLILNQDIQFYRQFLTLSMIGDGTPIAVTEGVDLIWHNHILDTSKYIMDCHNLFGGYFHHFPYFGLRSESDYENLVEASKTTNDLYKQYFQISPFELTTGSLCNGGSECGKGCAKCVQSQDSPSSNPYLDVLNQPRPVYSL